MGSTAVWTVFLLFLALVLSVMMGIIIHRGTQDSLSGDGLSESLTELEKYVKRDDSMYSYTILPQYTARARDNSYKVYVLNMTSQTWLSREYDDNFEVRIRISIIHLYLFLQDEKLLKGSIS